MGAVIQDLVANVDHLVFDTEMALDTQLGAQLLPFHGMDKTGAAVCVYFSSNASANRCEKGSLCPYRHIVGDKMVVCKHWLRGLCKKGDQCEFLHEYDLAKMPECYFFSKYNACSNKECPFRHIDPESRIKDCPWYDRGFCRHDGPSCKFTHPRFDLPAPDPVASHQRKFGLMHILCHNCHERGHKASNCPNLPGNAQSGDVRNQHQSGTTFRPSGNIGGPRTNVADITCYRCGERGHFANRCTKGPMAFLSAPQGHQQSSTRPAGEMHR